MTIGATDFPYEYPCFYSDKIKSWLTFDEYAESLRQAVQKGDVMSIQQLQGELCEYERGCVKERLSVEEKQQYRNVMHNVMAMKEQNNG